MADTSRKNDKARIRPPCGWIAFVAQVVTDPNNRRIRLLLFGYLGASSEADHVRLYIDPQLSDWIDIPSLRSCTGSRSTQTSRS